MTSQYGWVFLRVGSILASLLARRELYTEICNENAPLRKIKVRSQSLPWVTGKLRHKMNLRYKLLKKAKRTGRQDVRQRYKTIRNEVTKELRRCKAEYYNDQFQKVKNTKLLWELINKASKTRVDPPPPAIRRDDGTLATSDKKKSRITEQLLCQHRRKSG